MATRALSVLLLIVTPSIVLADPGGAPPVRRDVNFAVAGATTGTLNTVDVFTPDATAAIRAAGLDTGGLELQLELAIRTLADVDRQRDLFWVWAGANDYITGTADPSRPPARIREALERLYRELGARRFVVPNLFPIGFIPVLKSMFPPEVVPAVRQGLNQLALAHNQFLASELASFAAEHPDSTVIPVDMNAVFLAFFGRYTNTTDSCIEEVLPSGSTCDGVLFFDSLHFESEANQEFGAAAAEQLEAAAQAPRVRRVVAFGDSLSDTGAFFDTTFRATGIGIPPSPPYFDMRFSDGPLGIDRFQDLIGVQYTTAFFSQPFRTSVLGRIEASSGRVRGSLPLHGRVYVPKSILTASLATGSEGVTLEFDAVRCFYRAGPQDRPGTLSLRSCTTPAREGSLISVQDQVSVDAPASVGSELEIELLFLP